MPGPIADWAISTGAIDSFGYEKLEVIRGANGLLTGVGNASGTINYVRKRPGNERRASLELIGGSWDLRRMEADLSTPITGNGAWAARAVVAAEDQDSYLRGLGNDRFFVQGVIDGQQDGALDDAEAGEQDVLADIARRQTSVGCA